MENKKEIGKAVNALIEKNKDAERGFQEASKDAEGEALKNFLKEQAKKRKKYAEELKTELNQLEISVDTDEGGSVSGTVHRGWLSIKDALTSGDESILEECIRGDKASIEEYKEVWEDHRHLPSQLMDTMSKQVTDIQKTLQKIKSLEDLK